MSVVKLDITGFRSFFKGVQEANDDWDAFAEQFLLECAREVWADSKALTPVDTGDLRNRWEISKVYRTPASYYIEIFNTVYYASYIEYGHKQQVGRFVPGVISNGKFTYVKGAKSGIVLKKPFVNGFHMCQISLTRLQGRMRQKFERAFRAYCKRFNL